MNTLKNILLFMLLSFILNIGGYYIESKFLMDFLCANLIIILLTLLAINTATTGLLSIKMAELESKFPKIDFNCTYKEMKYSLKEQLVLVIISVILLIINGSELIVFQFKDIVIGTFLTTVFIYAIYILKDTGEAVFDLLILAGNLNK